MTAKFGTIERRRGAWLIHFWEDGDKPEVWSCAGSRSVALDEARRIANERGDGPVGVQSDAVHRRGSNGGGHYGGESVLDIIRR